MPTLPDIQQVFARRGKSQASLRELMAALGVDRRDRITFRRELDRLVRAGALVRLKGHQVYGLPPGRETKGRSGDRTARPLMVGWLSRVGRYGTVTPFDPATDAPVRLFKGACRGLAPGTYLLVRRGPEGIGRIEEVLGDPAQPGTDERAVLLHHDLPHTFPQAVERELAALPERVEQADLAGREDRRDRPIVTIDGPDARDFDDAVEVASRPGGGWRLGVHIADVSRYVAEGSALDREARRRGASCYFPTTVVPMLPHPLSSHLCSLQEGVDRLTLSVELAIDPRGTVTGTRIFPAVIRSQRRCTYEEIQAVLDRDAAPDRFPGALVAPVREMRDLARVLIRARRERGSLDFTLPETVLTQDAAGTVVDVGPAPRRFSHRIIEEFMILANEAVARFLRDRGSAAIYRTHAEPELEKVAAWNAMVDWMGYGIRFTDEGVTPRDVQRVLKRAAGKREEPLISYLLLRTMQQAEYRARLRGHFGLASDCYCHFTSPIRRYPDLVAHRLVTEALGRAAPPETARASRREREITAAERDLTNWRAARFFADREGTAYDGLIVSTHDFGFFVQVAPHQVEGLVPVASLPDDYYELRLPRRALIGRETGRSFHIGDRVRVRLERADVHRRRLEFSLIPSADA